MSIIDADGLFNGKRLRKCSPGARLTWPYLYLLSNGFGRIELDYDAIAFRFVSFRDAAPSGSQIGVFFDEYELQHLIFSYDADGQNWGQWDTRSSHLKKFKTLADKQSPNPPEPMYGDWLREQHGGDWRAYHWNAAVRSGGEHPDRWQLTQAFPNSLEKVHQNLLKSAPTLARDFGLGVGLGHGVGFGDGRGIGGGGGNHLPPEILVEGSHGVPADATPPELVSGLLERLGIPSNVPIFKAVAESIRVKAISAGISASDAANAILLKGALARKNPPESWLFWFRDARYDQESREEAADAWIKRQSDDAR